MNNTSTDIIKRQLLIIQILLEGNYVSTRQIQDRLSEHSIDAKLRSIQRDLVTLEDILPVECRKDDKPYSWRWQRFNNTKQNQLSLSQAIALRMVETELKDVIPIDLYDRLQPLFLKSHFVTGLSQLKGFDTLNTKVLDGSDLINKTKPDKNKGFHTTSKQSIMQYSPLQHLIISLRVRHEQRRHLKKKIKSKPSDVDVLNAILEDEDKYLLNDLSNDLLDRDLISLARLLKI